MRPPRIGLAEFAALADEGVPFSRLLGCRVERLEWGLCVVRLPCRADFLRPGGTISGPALMAVADIALYGAVLSMIGRVELAVTSDLTIHFLRKPNPGDLLATARVLKLGRRLSVGAAAIAAAGGGPDVAHVVATYALPEAGGAGD